MASRPDSPSGTPHLSRRAFLGAAAAGGAGVALAAITGGTAGALLGEARNRAISPLVLSSDLYASPNPQRFAFAIARGAKFASVGPAQVAFAAPGSKEGEILETNLYKEGLPKGRGIYVVDTTFPVAGVYKAAAITPGKQTPFVVQVNAAPQAPIVGAAASRAASPTTGNALGVNPICTRSPVCPLHDVSLADVVATGKPVAVMFATPALCQSQYCGPVLDELLDIMAPYRDKVTMVHVEIYQSNRGATRAPTVTAWNLPSEPWFYTIDGSGIIQSRIDGAFATNETKAALDRLIA
jgi:hypothetical protein